jgi:hypothetical protein
MQQNGQVNFDDMEWILTYDHERQRVCGGLNFINSTDQVILEYHDGYTTSSDEIIKTNFKTIELHWIKHYY